MTTQAKLLSAVAASLLCLCNGPSAFAGALSTSGQGSRALGMGGAFTAVADDGSAIYYNPAGISQIKGTEIQMGLNYISPTIDYKTPDGVTQESTKDAFAPAVFVTHSFTDKLGVGLGLYAPYARDTVFHDDLSHGFISQRSKMTRTDLNLAASYQVIESVSVGVGVIGGYGMIDQSIPAGPALRITDNSDGFGAGGIAGLLWKINKYVQAGGTYRSRMTVQQHGDRTMEQAGSATTSDADTDVHYPASLGLGIAVKPIEKLILALEADWYEWSYMSTITTRTDLWPDSTAELATDDSCDFRVGGEYIFPYDIALRAGYGYIQGAIPDTNILPCKPDANAHEIDIGIGKYWKYWQVNLNYEYLFTNQVQPSDNIYGYNGKYDIAQHIAGVTVGYKR